MPLKEKLEIASLIVNLVGVPVAIVLYFLSKRQERIEREYGTYNSLDEKYIEYLKLCAENPDLDVFDLPADASPPPAKPGEAGSAALPRKPLIIFSVLLAILERAYLMYRDKSRAVQASQWKGWDGYIRDWATRPNFRQAWQALRGQYDADFEMYMERVLGRGVANAPTR